MRDSVAEMLVRVFIFTCNSNRTDPSSCQSMTPEVVAKTLGSPGAAIAYGGYLS